MNHLLDDPIDDEQMLYNVELNRIDFHSQQYEKKERIHINDIIRNVPLANGGRGVKLPQGSMAIFEWL
jgi:hypothetical protein